jgi:hypothetical protein
MSTGSQAERLDRAVDQLLSGSRPAADRSLEPLLDAASLVRAAMPPIPAAEDFESRLAGRIEQGKRLVSPFDALERFARRAQRHPKRIIAAGAVSSAAVGMTVTALALWRSRRHAAASGLAAAGRR